MHAMRAPVARDTLLIGGNYIHRLPLSSAQPFKINCRFSFSDGDNNTYTVSFYFRLTPPGKDLEHVQNVNDAVYMQVETRL